MTNRGQWKIYRTQELILTPNGQRAIQSDQALEITRSSVEAGFLINLPGNLLSVYLYLLTHVGQDFSLTTTPTVIASLLPCTPLEVERALQSLAHQEFIELEVRDGSGNEHYYTITLNTPPESLTEERLNPPNHPVEPASSISVGSNPTSHGEDDAVMYLLKQKAFSEEDLVRAISAMIPAQNLNYGFRQELDYWFKNFDKEVIKELIRRTADARERDQEMNCQAYMRKIASEWISEQIFNISDLERSDKLFRETRSLIEEFGIERQNEVARAHWQIIHNWINAQSPKDFALSTEVARLAIQEAIRRKSDGRPSLAYIEDNFIKPFKENKIKTVEEGREFLLKQKSDKTNTANGKATKNDTQQTKWQIGVDFTRFREN